MEKFFEVAALPGTKVTRVTDEEVQGVIVSVRAIIGDRSKYLDSNSYLCLWEDGNFTRELAHSLISDNKKLSELPRNKYSIPSDYECCDLMEAHVKTNKSFDLLYFEKDSTLKTIVEDLALFPPKVKEWVESDLMGAEVSSYSYGQYIVRSIQLASYSKDFRLIGAQGSQMASALQKDVQILSTGEKCLIPVIELVEPMKDWTANSNGWAVFHYDGNIEAKWRFIKNEKEEEMNLFQGV